MFGLDELGIFLHNIRNLHLLSAYGNYSYINTIFYPILSAANTFLDMGIQFLLQNGYAGKED